jgi:hypothetical protein
MVGTASGANGLRLYHGAIGGTPTSLTHTNSGGTQGFEAIQFGDLPYGTDEWFDGLLAHLKVWDTALSATEIEAEFGRATPARTSNLISYHSFSNATLATALIPDTGTGTFDVFTANPSTSTDMPVFASGPTLSGTDTLPEREGVAPTIITTTLADGLVGAAYSQTLAATGDAPITWSVTSGSLPSGVSLGSSTGIISGTPSGSGSSSFTITATNAFGSDPQALSITVTSPAVAPTVTTTSLAVGNVGTAYSRTLAASGDQPITWSVVAGSLPGGLSLAGSTGVISGTPTTAGTSNFTVRATNSAGTDDQALSILVTQTGTGPTITTTTLPTGTVDVLYAQTVVATGTAPITWSVASGSLPTGLSLNTATGVVSGLPTASGSYTFALSATNVAGTAALTYTVTIEPAPFEPPAEDDGWIRLPRDTEIWVRVPRA